MKLRAYIAEFIATFALCFIGIGAIAANGLPGVDSGLVGIALAHGLAIAIFASATMAISGGHINPAVTIGLWATRHIGTLDAILYIVAQVVGAAAGAALLVFVLPDGLLASVGYGVPALGNGVGADGGFIIEVFLTFMLVYVIFGTAVDRRAPRMAGLYIGMAVTADIFIGGPFTGAAMNPARHFGPALIAAIDGEPAFLSMAWLYWLAPIVGAVFAALTYQYCQMDREIPLSEPGDA